MKSRKTYCGKFKANLVTKYINGKKDLKTLSEEYSIHPNQIKNWKSILLKRAHLVFDDRRKRKNHGCLK